MTSRGLLQPPKTTTKKHPSPGLSAKLFDRRRYPYCEDVRSGYASWAPSYDEVVSPRFGLVFLEDLDLDWRDVDTAVDLACGTGMAGPILARHGVEHIDGVDFTEEMIEKAGDRQSYRQLVHRDLTENGLDDHAYDLVLLSLAHEHFADLRVLYREFSRLVASCGDIVVIGYHPFFQLMGVPTHFRNDEGNISIESWVHGFSDHFDAAFDCGFRLNRMLEQKIDQEWIRTKPRWEDLEGVPISFCLHFRTE